jgi:hypothetical protein
MNHRQLFDDNVRHVRAALVELDRLRVGYARRLQDAIAEPSHEIIKRGERALNSIESLIATLENIEAMSKEDLRKVTRAIQLSHSAAKETTADVA